MPILDWLLMTGKLLEQTGHIGSASNNILGDATSIFPGSQG
jgi:hypothetical protein